jgi:lysophospholipase L1-like esterase
LALSCAAHGPSALDGALSHNATPGLAGAASTRAENAPSSVTGPFAASASETSPEAIESKKADPKATSARPEALPNATADLPRGTLVLHVGDSFAGALGVPLGERLRAKGLRSVLKFQTSSYVPTWASSPELESYLSRYNPDLILITLGANEFELSAPDTRAGAVRRLVQHLRGKPCVWITPPRWKPDTGILAVIQANSQPCRFLDSDTIVHELGRKPDHIHPSDAAREVWADAVLAWLARERNANGAHPWEMKEP